MPELIGFIGLGILFTLLAVGVPIGFAMAATGTAGLCVLVNMGAGISALGIIPYSSVAYYHYCVIPLFIGMGQLASASGITEGLFKSFKRWFGHLPGGIAVATVVTCAVFAACCGSSTASAATMANLCKKEMDKLNYKPEVSMGVIAAGGTLGILIPPSTAFVLYGILTEQSIGRLFIAGILPGFLLAALLSIAVLIWAKMRPEYAPRGERFSWREKMRTMKDLCPAIVLALGVLGSLWGGICTPTEAGAVGVIGAVLIGICKKTLRIKSIIHHISVTVKTTGMIFIILVGAMIFNQFIALSGVPTLLAEIVDAYSLQPLLTLLLILLIYVILGCLMDTIAMTVLTIPIFFPIVVRLGFDPVWFGVIFVILSEMALITPPIGMNVFVLGAVAPEVPMHVIFRGASIFLLPMVITILILMICPGLALWLPSTMRTV